MASRLQGPIQECSGYLNHLVDLDEDIYQKYTGFEELLDRFDCTVEFSVHWTCSHCKVVVTLVNDASITDSLSRSSEDRRETVIRTGSDSFEKKTSQINNVFMAFSPPYTGAALGPSSYQHIAVLYRNNNNIGKQNIYPQEI
ncbi:hypothetical protein LOTGIDRAFT_168930 [Lottia gigantea]|uniref:Uncharacterized protein n=1 Tax=Lottia gigantea TaxID=225164 RepID=V4B5V3_LOTGI|nr:hypothetical protein LOTGIDRAFT_168930 [Lottia gigantea]ESO83889.1 hypothetical protein LOTGIDRAFT_168930 [Lottia gigantea]